MPPTSVRRFTNVYSRPNDDTFQNATGNAGVPFEVAVISVSLVAKPASEGARFNLDFYWQAEMVTGNYVEAGHEFKMTEVSNSLTGLTDTAQGGHRSTDITIHYPPRVGPGSSAHDKMGSKLRARLHLGEIRAADGLYSGVLQIQKKKVDPSKPGLPGGIFQKGVWRIRVRNGRVESGAIDWKEFHRNPKLDIHLFKCNYRNLDRSKPEHQRFPPQPPAAVCEDETVGDGNIPLPKSDADRRRLQVQKLILDAGCTNCHGKGSPNYRFCKNGKLMFPDEQNIYDLVFGRLPIPKDSEGMRDAIDLLKEDAELIERWALENGAKKPAGPRP